MIDSNIVIDIASKALKAACATTKYLEKLRKDAQLADVFARSALSYTTVRSFRLAHRVVPSSLVSKNNNEWFTLRELCIANNISVDNIAAAITLFGDLMTKNNYTFTTVEEVAIAIDLML